ncbi:MAG TPA: hypothetical protein V6C65_26315 [Allocoleopsis sp.]
MFTTDYFVQQVIMKGTLPGGRYENTEILASAYDVLLSQLVPLILDLREEYYVASESQAITAGTAEYPIPYRAFGLMLREVKRVYNGTIQNLSQIDPSEITSAAVGTPTSFYLEGQSVVLYPTPQSTDGSTLKLSYYRTPSKPVLTTAAALITNIDRVTGIVTATPPTSWTSNDTFDFVSQRNGHKTLGTASATLTTVDMTFSLSDIPASLEVGDYISLTGEAPYLQMPDNSFGLMVQLTANEFLEDLGDAQPLQIGMGKAEQLKGIFVKSMSTRVLGEPKKSRIRLR